MAVPIAITTPLQAVVAEKNKYRGYFNKKAFKYSFWSLVSPASFHGGGFSNRKGVRVGDSQNFCQKTPVFLGQPIQERPPFS